MTIHKSIFEYDDYRQYLRDYYFQSKSENKKFSFRYFSKMAGFKSHSVLRQVIQGESNIDPDSIEKYVKVLKLNKEQAYFFRHLVLFNQAKTNAEKQSHAEQLIRCRMFKKLHPLSSLQFNYFVHWYFVPIREMVGLKGFQEDPEWISKKLSPSISPVEAKRALDELQELGLIQRESDGLLKQTTANVSTGDEVTSAAFTGFHREMLKKASESIDRHPRDKRDISFVTLGLSGETIGTIKEMIQKFRKDLLEVASRDAGPDRVYQMNFQFFPLTDETTEEIS